MAIGVLFISPLTIRLLSGLGRRAPVASRLALRDLGRYQARAGAALAAISLALGIAVAIMISAAADKTAADAGNLPDNQVLAWIGQAGVVVLTTITTFTNVTHAQRIHAPAYSSDPTSLITPNGLRRLRWTTIDSGWLIESSRPLTAAQLAAARDAAAKAGLVIESRNSQASLSAISAIGTAAGALIALGVLAMAVGLIRAEAAGEVRTLTAIGATSTTRRALTATTAGALALLGALLGSAAAYLALAAGHRSDASVLGQVPVLDLTITIAGVPLAAAAAGWLLSGRKPESVARRPLD
jgi:putative ABC transport system permease protein